MALFSPTTTDVTGTTTTSVPDWLQGIIQGGLNRAVTLSQQPYTPYNQPRIASLTPDQLNAISMGRSNVGLGTLGLDQANTLLTNAMQAPTQAGLQAYMNPYSNLVTQDALTELLRQKNILDQQSNYNAVQAGAFGGNRSGLVLSENNRNYLNTAANLLNTANAQNYTQALGQFNAQQQLGLAGAQGLGSLASLRTQLGSTDVQNLLGLGALQQQQQQQGLDLAYQDFLTQQQYPYNQISFLLDRAAGVPSSQTVTTTQQQLGPSLGQQVGGIGMGLLGLAGLAKGIFS